MFLTGLGVPGGWRVVIDLATVLGALSLLGLASNVDCLIGVATASGFEGVHGCASFLTVLGSEDCFIAACFTETDLEMP